MTRFLLVAPLFCAALVLLGCSDYEVGTDYGAGDSPAEKATAGSPPSSHETDAPPAHGPDDETARPSRSDGPGEEQARVADVPSSQTDAGGQPAVEPAAPRPRPARSTPSQPTPTPLSSIKLSAGVALPQSLPTGTAMGFSIDYQFTAGQPGPSPYLWVIQPGKGQTAKQPVQLQRQGTLQMFVLQFRPENGPFHTHIEDAQGNRLSRSVLLKGW